MYVDWMSIDKAVEMEGVPLRREVIDRGPQ